MPKDAENGDRLGVRGDEGIGVKLHGPHLGHNRLCLSNTEDQNIGPDAPSGFWENGVAVRPWMRSGGQENQTGPWGGQSVVRRLRSCKNKNIGRGPVPTVEWFSESAVVLLAEHGAV